MHIIDLRVDNKYVTLVSSLIQVYILYQISYMRYDVQMKNNYVLFFIILNILCIYIQFSKDNDKIKYFYIYNR